MAEVKEKPVRLKNAGDLKNPYQLVMDEIKTKSRYISEWKRTSELSMFDHFIKLMGEKGFNDHVLGIISWLGGGKGSFGNFFFSFHKSMRQTDFYELNSDMKGEETGHIDMLFWDFIQISEIPYEVLKSALAKNK